MRLLRSLAIACAWISGLSFMSSAFAADSAESSSVIPILKSSKQHAGIPIEVETLTQGTSSRRFRRESLRTFPLAQMTPQSQAVACAIFNDLTLYRRLPKISLDVDRRTYEYFTSHPDVAVSIWRAMEISKVMMTEKSPVQYETDTRDGTRGVVDVLLKSPEHYIVVCRGEFKSPALKNPIQATAMMHLQPNYSQAGRVTHQLDMYVSLPSDAIAFIARLISPISNRIADRNFEEISLFVEMMSVAMQRQPGWIESIAEKLEGVSDEAREELLKTTAKVYVDAAKAEAVSLDPHSKIEDIMPPVRVVSAEEACVAE